MKKYLMAFNIILLLNSSYIYANNPSSQSFYPSFKTISNGNIIKLVFIKNNDSFFLEKAKIYSIDKNNDKEYITKIMDDEIVSVFQADGITGGKSVYLITRSRVDYGTKNGYSYNTTELPIITSKEGVSVRFFKGDPAEPKLQNCFDGIEKPNKKIRCNYKTQEEVNLYIESIHSKIDNTPTKITKLKFVDGLSYR